MNLTFDQILLFFVGLSLIIQLFYLINFYLRTALHNNNKIKSKLPAVSVIIAARNEEKNLANNLASILEQDYPKYEVIVVNDRSWDKSEEVLNSFKLKYSHLKIVNNPDLGNDKFLKKLAITIGIKAASYDYLLFTDADCIAESNSWISEMTNAFKDEKMIVLGAGPYKRVKGLLNKLIRFDAAFIAIQYLGMAKAKVPYMGVGRNLAYKKEIYESVRGFKSHYHIPSGDDDLFVNECAKRNNTAIVFSRESITFSIPKNSFKEWIKQKKRHQLTGNSYRFLHQIILFLYPLSLICFYTSCMTIDLFTSYQYLGLFAILCRMLIQIIIFMRPFKIMKCKDLIIFVPLLELLLLFIYVIFLIKKEKI